MGHVQVIYRAQHKSDACSWINGVVKWRNKNIAAVVLANKGIVWALPPRD
jgi:hypothetical protein